MPEDGGDNPTVEHVRKRAKWYNDDYVCRGLILNVLKHYNRLLGVLKRFTQHKMNMDESIQVSCIIDKLLPSWKDFKHTLKHLKEELTLVELGSHFHTEESLRAQDNDKPKGKNVASPLVVNMVEHNNFSRLGRVHIKRIQDMSKDGLIPAFDMDTEKCKTCMLTKITKKPFQNVKCEIEVLELIHDDLYSLHVTPSLGNKKYFVTFIDDAFRFYVIEPNESVEINSIIESRDTIFDENTFLYVPRPSQRSLVNGTKDSVGSVAPEKVIDEGFKQKSGIDYFDTYALVAHISTIRLLIDMALIHNLIIHHMDVKTTFLNGELEEEVYMNQPQGFIMPGSENKMCKQIKSLYGLKYAPNKWHQKFDEVVLSNGYLLNQVDKCVYRKFDESGEADVILSIRIKHETNGTAVSQSHYVKKVLKYLKKTIDYRLTYTGYPSVLEGYTNASWISKTKEHSSTSGWVFLLGGGVIYWAFKKQMCITGSIMKSEFMALAAAGKEAEWLKNLLFKILLWSKLIALISIRCDSAATLAKAYSHMFNGKSRHLGVRHSMICELITNRVESIEFMRSQQNLAHHLTKGIARDLVIKFVEVMGLKSN
nr:zinc finger, CCHC-type [Tanacetum cinerariifolium]